MSKLILSRLPQQAVHISHPDGEITIRVLNVSGPSVRLLFDAPKSVEVMREELAVRPKPSAPIDEDVSYPCANCPQDSYTMDGLCFSCQQRERKD